MKRPISVCRFRFREKASVFLTELHPAKGPEERTAILASIRKRDFDASHHCFAWREGAPVKVQGCDDDGEPGGTAGAPMLRVLEGEGLTDSLAVCIRWFGGTKLGTGGLVRAYTEGTRGVIGEAQAQGLLEEVRILRVGSIAVPAGQAHLPFATLGAYPHVELLGQVVEGANVIVRFHMPPGREAEVEAAWRERSRGGKIHWEG